MLIILNGMFGTNIENIAKAVSFTLNNPGKIQPNNFDVNEFNELNISITDKNDYIHEEDANKIINLLDEDNAKKDNELIIEELNNVLAKSPIEDLKLYFLDSIMYDLECDYAPGYFNSDKTPKYIGWDTNDYTPANIISKYKESKATYFVICGQIGKHMIDALINANEGDITKVFNIVRNPVLSNVSTKIFNQTIPADYLIYDVYNAKKLKSLDYVTTYNFEDIMKHKLFKIENYVNNPFVLEDNLLTSIENANENFKNVYVTEILDELNKFYSDIDILSTWNTDKDKDAVSAEFKKSFNKDIPNLKCNILTDLGYEEIKI